MMDKQCSNCGAVLTRPGILTSGNQLVSNTTSEKLDTFLSKENGEYCNQCLGGIKNDIKKELSGLNRDLEGSHKVLEQIPIVSIHSPADWQYDVLGVVTGQSTTGTGVVAEIASGFTDLFGMQSGIYNEKLSEGENFCFNQIRLKTLQMGGNAIVALDLDYSELGSIKGMIMVCATGTAIKLKNTDIIERKWDSIETMKHKFARRDYLDYFNRLLSISF